MFDRQQLLRIISGQRSDPVAWLTRGAMSLLTPVYRAVVAFRNWRFDRDDGSRVQRAQIPVISVGNLTTGGTGKTPMVIFLSQYLRRQNKRVVIISRGYQGSQHASTSRNDEALEMETRLPDVPHLQDPNRFRMTQIAVEELESEIVLLDDGFQHRQLHRDLDVVLIDATEPFGYGRLLPRGLLREPTQSLARADFVAITRCHLVDDAAIANIEAAVKSVASRVPIARTTTAVRGWVQHDGTETSIDQLLDQPVFVFCGIGNPAGFLATLKQLGVDIVGQQVFEDHHVFSRQDLDSMAESAQRAGAKVLVCTHKDLVKIGVNRFRQFPVHALLIDLEFVSNEQPLTRLIDQVAISTIQDKGSD